MSTRLPDHRGVYHGCANSKTGALRVVKAASSCRKTRTVKRGKRHIRIPGELAIAWNQRGTQGRPGVDDQGAVWPGERLRPSPLTLLVDGPGSADVALTEQIGTDTPEARVDHQDLSTDDTVFSQGVKGGTTDHNIGTMVLSADPTAPVVQIAFVMVDDATQAGRCSFIGTATAAA